MNQSTNFGLKTTGDNDQWRDTLDYHNENMGKIDSVLDANQDALGIVVDGNKSALGASSGQYIILRNSTISGKADGLYTAAKAIPANTAIDGTYLTEVPGGGLNALNSKTRKTISISGTTDGTGDIALNMYVSDIVPLAIYGQGAKGYVFMCSSDNNKWWVKFINDNLSNAANESVSFTLIYMERQ